MISFKQFLNEEEQEKDMEVHYPGGVYIATNLSEETATAVKEYQEKYLKQYEVNEELHCTLIYSQKPHVDELEPASYQATATFGGFDLFGPNKDTLVIELISEDLVNRNAALVEEHGFISDYKEYKPHITLAYGIECIDLNSLPAIEFQMTLEDEYIDQLDPNWGSDDEDSEDDESGTFVGKEMKKSKAEQEKETDSEEEEESN